jgi:hypothetical protein
MHYLKLQQNLLKDALSKKAKNFFVGVWEENELVGITEGHVIWLIPKSKFVFDAKKLKELGIKEILSINKMFYLDNDLQDDGIMSGDIRILDGKEAVKIKSKDGGVWVNREFLNEFDKDRTFKISTKKSTSPVFVYEKGELVGLILPIVMK